MLGVNILASLGDTLTLALADDIVLQAKCLVIDFLKDGKQKRIFLLAAFEVF